MEFERPNYKPFIITIIILILTIGGLVAFIVLNRIEKQKEIINQKTIINNMNLNLNVFFDISKILESFDNAYNYPNSSYYGYIYNTEKKYASKFDFGAAVFLEMNDEMIGNANLQFVSEKAIKTKIEKTFGKNFDYDKEKEKLKEKEGKVQINKNNYYNIEYNEENKVYAYVLQIPIAKNNGYIAITVNTKLTENNIIVSRKVAYVEYGDNIVTIYKDHSKNNKIGQVELKNGIINKDEIVGKYGSSMSTFDYYFEQKNNDKYYFSKINKTK